jgi:hypothetical protein
VNRLLVKRMTVGQAVESWVAVGVFAKSSIWKIIAFPWKMIYIWWMFHVYINELVGKLNSKNC